MELGQGSGKSRGGPRHPMEALVQSAHDRGHPGARTARRRRAHAISVLGLLMAVAGCSGDWSPPAGGARVVFAGWKPGPGQFITGVCKNIGPATAYRVTIYSTACGQHYGGYTMPESLPPGA